MSGPALIWVLGMYTSVLKGRMYGGLTRTLHLMRVLAEEVERALGAPVSTYVVTLRRPRSRPTRRGEAVQGYEVLELELSTSSKLVRGLRKLLERLGLVGARSAVNLCGVAPKGLGPLREVIEAHEPRVLALGGPPGYASMRRYMRYMRERCDLVVYVSFDYALDYYTGLLSGRVRRLENEALSYADMVLAASRRDAEKYRTLHRPKAEVLAFPNIYPPREPLAYSKPRDELTVALVGGRLLSRDEGFRRVVRALAGSNVRVVYVGKLPEGIRVDEHHEYVPSRHGFLEVLSRAHIGVNHALWGGGSNVKRYDYALAGLVVLSNPLGARGEVLPAEYVYVDEYDLKAKLGELEEMGLERLEQLGLSNARVVHERYEEALARLRESLARHLSR